MLVEYYERLRCTRIDMNCRVYRPLCGDSYVDLIKLNSVVTAIQDLSPFKPFDPASIVLDKVAITHISDPKKFYDCVKNALDGWKSLGHESRSHSGMCRVKLKKEKYTHAMQPDARDIEVVLSEWMSLVAKKQYSKGGFADLEYLWSGDVYVSNSHVTFSDMMKARCLVTVPQLPCGALACCHPFTGGFFINVCLKVFFP